MSLFRKSKLQPSKNGSLKLDSEPLKLDAEIRKLQAKIALPRRIAAYVIVRDESGSMTPYREPKGIFIPKLIKEIKEAAGPKVEEALFVEYVVISGKAVSSGFHTLRDVKEPAYIPDLGTPLGKGLSLTASEIEKFIQWQVFAQEVSLRSLEILICSDCYPDGETEKQTASGIQEFVATIKKYRAKVTVVAPQSDAVNYDIAKQLDVNGVGIRFLNGDTKGIFSTAFESLLNASRMVL